MSIRFTYTREGWFYYQRAVPGDLTERYGKLSVKHALKTKSPETAARLVERINATLEAEWERLRVDPAASVRSLNRMARSLLAEWGLKPKGEGRNDPEAVDVFLDQAEAQSLAAMDERPLEHLPAVTREAVELIFQGHKPGMEDALDFYLGWHQKGSDEGFQKVPRIAVAQFIKAVGDKALEDITRDDVRAWMLKAVDEGQSQGTIQRRLGSLCAIVTAFLREKELDIPNRFERHTVPAKAKKPEERETFTTDELGTVQAACKSLDDDVRWATAILSDTCSRLAEIVGLRLSDIVLDAPVPYINIEEHAARSLKTTDSKRVIPLVGVALWAAQRVKATATDGQSYAFPRYVKDGKCNALTASATINKWLRSQKVEHTTHDFRHTMADRLRDVGCPKEIRDQIGGWSRTDMSENYGRGQSLERIREWLIKTVLPETATKDGPVESPGTATG